MSDSGVFYDILHDGKRLTLPRVTSILKVIDKSGPMMGWAVKVERAAMFEALEDALTTPGDLTPKIVMDHVAKALAGKRAHVKSRDDAANIGKAAHDIIKWQTAKMLGEADGPEPSGPEGAERAVVAWLDWAKSVDFTPLHTELLVYCPACATAGTLDAIGKVEGKVTLVDYKCLLPEQTVVTADGWTMRADEVLPGDALLSWDGSAIVVDTVADVTPGGVQPAVEVVTRFGRRLRVSANHPVLTRGRWIAAADLRRDDPLEVVAHAPESPAPLTTDEAALLGYLVGDGGVTGHHRRFTTTTPEIQESVTQLCGRLGFTFTQERSRVGKAPSFYLGGIGSFLVAHGLAGVGAREKRVPSAVLAGTDAAVRAFLTAYFDCDGFVSGTDGRVGRIMFCTSSPRLAAETLELAWRLGVQMTAWRNENPSPPGADPWLVTCASQYDVARLASILSDVRVPKKRERLAWWGAKHAGAPRHRVKTEAVANVTPLGDLQTIAITMTTHGTFVTSGIVTHNTGKAVYDEAHLQVRVYEHMAKRQGIHVERRLILRLPKTAQDPDFEVVPAQDIPYRYWISVRRTWEWQRIMQGESTGSAQIQKCEVEG